MNESTIYPIHWLRMTYGCACWHVVMALPRLSTHPLCLHALGWAGYYAYQPEPWWRPLSVQLRASRGRGS